MIADLLAAHPRLTVQHACDILGISRSSFYRRSVLLGGRDRELDMRELVEAIALEFSGYGYRRIHEELRRRGYDVGERSVRRMMRLFGLVAKKQQRWIATTDSNHGHKRYPNLLRNLEVKSLDQVWCSDLTYIRLERDFCFLAAILDLLSRRIVGWHLSKRLDASLAVTALKRALAERSPEPGWIHHSDQGVQYACRAYVDTVHEWQGQVSMSRVGTPYDNAHIESFFKTLKAEEVYLNEYRTAEEAQRHIGQFIDHVYNVKRLHSALGYRPPAEFESMLISGQLVGRN